MHRRPILPLGVKFDPTDGQLISGYLGPQVRGERLAWNAIGFSDLVYKKPPWEFCTDLTAFPGDEKHYFFTELKKNKNRVVRTVGSYGAWHGSSCKEISGGSNYNNNNGIIGFNRLLNFKKGKEMTDWLMHEFSLPEKETNLVLCVIQKKKKKEEEMGSAHDPEFDPMSFLEHESTASAVGAPSPATAPAPAPAPVPDNHLELQVLDSEEEETRPSKMMRPDPKLDDHPVSVASISADLPPDYWDIFAKVLSEGSDDVLDFPDDVSGVPDVSGLPDDETGLPNAVFGLPDDEFFDFQAPPFEGDS